MNPLAIATSGYLHGPLSIATSGYLVPGSEVTSTFTPDDVPHPPGMGRRKQIMEEDEAIMAVIIAFLETKR